MTTGRLKPIHLAQVIGMSLFIPLFLACSPCVDLSETLPLSSDMRFEGPDDEDFSNCQNEFKIPVPKISPNPLSPWAHFGRRSGVLFISLTSHTQVTSFLRC